MLGSLKGFGKTVFWTFVGTAVITTFFVAIVVIGIFSPWGAFYSSLVLLVVPGIAFFRPMPVLKLGNRWFSGALALCAGGFGVLGSLLMVGDEQRRELAALKTSDPAAYLAELQASDSKKWLTELAELDPGEHTRQMALIAEEQARLEQEQARLAQEQAAKEAAAQAEKTRRLLAKWEKDRLAREAKAARECGPKNNNLAYVMSQSYVKQGLKAPSTAKFPWATDISVQSIGDCKFRISAYVDSQNSFGAMLRTRYTATMQHFPDKGSWTAVELNFSG